MTIVGSRRATAYGREVARDLARELSAAGLIVVSGLAFGIDACAHRGALDAGGPTIAVLGCGPDTSYPAAHRSLWRRIAETGAVISELPPGATPWRWSFPARNRVMAALAGMTVVVEAAAALGLADHRRPRRRAGPRPRRRPRPGHLARLGRPERAARRRRLRRPRRPGRARRDARRRRPPVAPRGGPPLDPELAAVLAAVEAGADHRRRASPTRHRPDRPPRAATALTRLELLGYLAASPVGTFTRTTLAFVA